MHTASQAFTKKQCEQAVFRAFWRSWVVFWDARGISGDHRAGSGSHQERPWAMPGSLGRPSGMTLAPSWMAWLVFKQALGGIRAWFSGLGCLPGLVFAGFWHRCAGKRLLCETYAVLLCRTWLLVHRRSCLSCAAVCAQHIEFLFLIFQIFKF